MATPAAGGSAAELLTQLQDQVDAVSRKFFESVGVMQRDAPPFAAPDGPPLAAAVPSPGFDVQSNAQRMATEITQQVQLTEQLLQLLPDGLGCISSCSNGTASSHEDGSQQQDVFTAEVRALQQQHAEVSQQLQAAVGEVEGQLLQLQQLYAALAKAKLQAQAQARAR